jgi:hypothetical protein
LSADSPGDLRLLQMEYRNTFILVFRSSTSAGWDWAVDLDERTVTGGRAATEQAAIEAAARLIDRTLARPPRKLTLVRPSGDGRS